MTRFKDINECLQAGVTLLAVMACVAAAEVIKPDKLKGIYEFENAIWEKFHPAGGKEPGLLLPWGNQFKSSLPFRFRYGEVTVWTGYNKHGKSEALNHCMIDLCWQGDRTLICSLEMPAPETYQKLIRMTHAQSRGTIKHKFTREEFAQKVLKPLAQKVWVYDAVGNADIEEVLQVMLYAYQRFGVRQFVLDSLMRFKGLGGDGQEKWQAQKEFMDRIITFTQTYPVHVHLVAHSKKPNDRKGEAIIPTRYDVAGSADITNLAFNVIVFWRNRAKQNALQVIFQSCSDIWVEKFPDAAEPEWKRLLGGAPEKNAPQEFKDNWNAMLKILESLPGEQREEFQELVLQHDAYFIVDAQRGGDGDCPARHLWFHFDSLQFLEVSPWKLNDKRRVPVCYAAKNVVEMDEEI